MASVGQEQQVPVCWCWLSVLRVYHLSPPPLNVELPGAWTQVMVFISIAVPLALPPCSWATGDPGKASEPLARRRGLGACRKWAVLALLPQRSGFTAILGCWGGEGAGLCAH